MRRIITWASATVAMLVLLLGYHTSTSSTVAGQVTDTVISSGSVAGSGSGSGSGSGTTTSGGTGGSSGTGSGSASTGSGSSGSSSAGSSGTQVTGSLVQTRYGPVQVQLAVSGGKITSASILQYPSGDPRSSQISNYALPVLADETVSAQSASIDMVSGATFTSAGYLQSLQSALDQAGL